MTYNITQLQEVSTITGLVNYANDSSTGILVGLFMIGIFFVLLVAMKRHEFEHALLASSGIAFMLSTLLVYAKLLNFVFATTFLIIFALTTFYVYVIGR